MGEVRNPRKRFSQSLALALLRATGWKLDVRLPASSRFVLVGAPHTSNWDLWHALLLKYAIGLKLNWVGKDNLFWWPLGVVMRRLGGIPVNRRSSNQFVQQISAAFQRDERLVIAIAPEGTRKKVGYWKTGFYYMALSAGVPIALGFIDYRTRVIGIGPSLQPSGDIQADFEQIIAFYAEKVGRRPEHQGTIQIKPASNS